MKFGSVVDSYIADMNRAGRFRSPHTELAYRTKLERLGEQVHNRDPRTVGRADVRAALALWPNPNSQRQAHAIFAAFFDWCMAVTADGGQSLTIDKTDGYYYVGFVVGTQATTAVQFFRSGSSAGPGQLGLTAASTPPARFMSKTGFAGGLPTSVVYSTCSVSSFLWWTGVAA